MGTPRGGHTWSWLQKGARPAQEEALGIRGLCRFSQALPLRGWHLGVRSHPCPKGTWRIGKPLGAPLSQALQHLLEAQSPRRARDSHWNCLSSHKSPQSVRTSKPTAWPWFTGGKTEALRQNRMDLPTGNWCLSLCPLRKHQATSSGGLRTCKRPHGLSLPCAHFPSPAVLPGRVTPQPECKGHQLARPTLTPQA